MILSFTPEHSRDPYPPSVACPLCDAVVLSENFDAHHEIEHPPCVYCQRDIAALDDEEGVVEVGIDTYAHAECREENDPTDRELESYRNACDAGKPR